MKINEVYTSGPSPLQAEKAAQAEAVKPGQSKQAASRAANQADQVHLSELSDRLLKIASAQSAERAVRLERLGAEVRAGRYQVDPLKVSHALVEEALKGG